MVEPVDPLERGDFDLRALLEEIRGAARGDVLEVTSDDAHVRVVID